MNKIISDEEINSGFAGEHGFDSGEINSSGSGGPGKKYDT
jgi:hypothetical protein